MDHVLNPFAPGAGNPPPELAGRLGLLASIETGLRRVALGRPSQSVIMVGLRGVGKTVLLVRIGAIAEEIGYRTLMMEAHDGRTLSELMVPGLRSALVHFSAIRAAADAARQGLRMLKGFLRSVSLKMQDVELGLALEDDSGKEFLPHTDLPELLVSVGQAARAAGRPMALLLDEVQYLSPAEFSALIMAMHRVSQLNLPLVFAGAGLPQLPALAGDSKTYAERMFQFPQIGALEAADATSAIRKPVAAEGAEIDDEAIGEILNITACYPYFLQQWAHDSWNIAEGGRITRQDVLQATPVAIAVLDRDFFRVRFDRCNASEKRYLRALAALGPGAHRSGQVADRVGAKLTSLAPARDKLIRKGMIYAPRYGEVAFTVPLFDAYMKRVMPDEV
jgi:hypothetical protein